MCVFKFIFYAIPLYYIEVLVYLKVGIEYSKKVGTEKVKVLTLARNRGKGGAIRMVCAIFRILINLILSGVSVWVNIDGTCAQQKVILMSH